MRPGRPQPLLPAALLQVGRKMRDYFDTPLGAVTFLFLFLISGAPLLHSSAVAVCRQWGTNVRTHGRRARCVLGPNLHSCRSLSTLA